MDNYEVNDSSETGPVNGYIALDPSTPGFSGKIKAMEGIFTKIEINANTGEINKFAYPLMMKNTNDNLEDARAAGVIYAHFLRDRLL